MINAEPDYFSAPAFQVLSEGISPVTGTIILNLLTKVFNVISFSQIYCYANICLHPDYNLILSPSTGTNKKSSGGKGWRGTVAAAYHPGSYIN